MDEAGSCLLEEALHLHRSGDLPAAKRAYLRLLEEQPPNPVVIQWLAVAYTQERRYVEALELFSTALKLDPNYADAYRNRGNALCMLGRLSEAVESFDKAIQLNPEQAEAHHGRAQALRQLERYAEALSSVEQALALKPDYVNALKTRALILRSMGQLDEAFQTIESAFAISANNAEAWTLRGNILFKLDRLDESLASYDRALAIQPRYVDAHFNRSFVLESMMRLEESLACCEKVLELAPCHVDAHWQKGALLVFLGDYLNGWKLAEWRWKSEQYRWNLRGLEHKRWNGVDDLNGKTVLVSVDGGFGDVIQFCRYVPMLMEQGAQVILEAQKSLLPLLAASFTDIKLAIYGEPLPPFDFDCPVMSLPAMFPRQLKDIPASIPYLRVPLDRVEKWKAKLAPRTRPRIGFVCSGNVVHGDKHRRIPMDQLKPLFDVDAEFHCLQKEILEQDRAIMADLSIQLWESQLEDHADTAALILCLDLVITIDTSVAHLAGALGKPVWVLLPFSADMRWLADREDSPWYPGVMRLFRQPKTCDWSPVVARVITELGTDLSG